MRRQCCGKRRKPPIQCHSNPVERTASEESSNDTPTKSPCSTSLNHIIWLRSALSFLCVKSKSNSWKEHELLSIPIPSSDGIGVTGRESILHQQPDTTHHHLWTRYTLWLRIYWVITSCLVSLNIFQRMNNSCPQLNFYEKYKRTCWFSNFPALYTQFKLMQSFTTIL